MKDEYFDATTLFGFGRVLAIERIFILEGIYPQLQTHAEYRRFADYLKQNSVDSKLQGMGFHRYDRIALAEAVMRRDEQFFRPATYLEFRELYGDTSSRNREWLAPALKTISAFDSDRIQTVLLPFVTDLSQRLSHVTNVRSALP